MSYCDYSRPTYRQRAILDWISAHVRERGYPPSVREIAYAFGIRSPNGVAGHLEALERKGYIRRDPLVARGLELIEPAAERGLPLYTLQSLATAVQEGAFDGEG